MASASDSLSLSFGAAALDSDTAYKLIEIPPDLAKLFETERVSLSIKGNPADDATLHTANKTYSIRAVSLSNTLAVATGPVTPDEDADVVIRSELNEIYELIPAVPRLSKLTGMLKGLEYDEGREDLDAIDSEQEDENADQHDERPRKRRRVSYSTALTEIQASPDELSSALTTRRILVLSDTLRPLAPSLLTAILEYILTHLISLNLKHEDVPVEELASSLQESHDVDPRVCRQVMQWFGTVQGGEGGDGMSARWRMDVPAVLREVGIGLLRNHRHDPIDEDNFLSLWRRAAGDAFESEVNMSLLSGQYITVSSSFSLLQSITYFPSQELPVDPATRFADLFATCARWKAADIGPFLSDIAVDNKDRDKFLLKFARAITDAEGTWYAARTK